MLHIGQKDLVFLLRGTCPLRTCLLSCATLTVNIRIKRAPIVTQIIFIAVHILIVAI